MKWFASSSRRSLLTSTAFQVAALTLIVIAIIPSAAQVRRPNRTPPLRAFAETQAFSPDDVAAGDEFGFAIAVDNDTAIISGARNDSNGGSAYIYTHDSTGWTKRQRLLPDPSSAGVVGLFGISVAISGNMAVVGACDDDVQTTSGGPVVSGAGAVYVYARDASGNWQQEKRLFADTPGTGDRFGHSVAISGNTIAVGANGVDVVSGSTTAVDAGAVYIFTRTSPGDWQQQTMLRASDAGPNVADYFGWSIAMDATTLVVGAPFKQFFSSAGNYFNDGAVYVFDHDAAGVWTQRQKLMHGLCDVKADNRFGYSVSVNGGRLAAGAWEMGVGPGAAYIFARNTGTGSWDLEQKLTASDGARGDGFGYSVAISGDIVVAGAFEATIGPLTDAGAAYVFHKDSSGVWGLNEKLNASDFARDDLFGNAVAVVGDSILVGSYMDDVGPSSSPIPEAGSVYVFEDVRSRTTPNNKKP